MTTLVGTQKNLVDAVNSLIELDHDAAEAYQAAINRLENSQYKTQLQQFCEDHQRHITELSSVLQQHGATPAKGPDLKKWLTQGKVIIGALIGDKAILKAMLSNEGDTNTAYQNMRNRLDLWEELKVILERGLSDEQKHKQWLEMIIDKA